MLKSVFESGIGRYHFDLGAKIHPNVPYRAPFAFTFIIIKLPRHIWYRWKAYQPHCVMDSSITKSRNCPLFQNCSSTCVLIGLYFKSHVSAIIIGRPTNANFRNGLKFPSCNILLPHFAMKHWIEKHNQLSIEQFYFGWLNKSSNLDTFSCVE